jgi:hypothetical protein
MKPDVSCRNAPIGTPPGHTYSSLESLASMAHSDNSRSPNCRESSHRLECSMVKMRHQIYSLRLLHRRAKVCRISEHRIAAILVALLHSRVPLGAVQKDNAARECLYQIPKASVFEGTIPLVGSIRSSRAHQERADPSGQKQHSDKWDFSGICGTTPSD